MDKENRMEIKIFGVIGAGQMGNGIAQVGAISGFNVIMNDISMEFLSKGMKTIERLLIKGVEKGKISPDEKEAVLGRIRTTTDITEMKSADFIVEAATENEPIKFQLFKDLDGICAPHVILSSHTSSIPIGRIAAKNRRPDKD